MSNIIYPPSGSNGSVQPYVYIGGRFILSTNLITLGSIVAGGSNTNGTFRKGDSSSGYTPSGANKFRALAARILVRSAIQVTLGYADNDQGILVGGSPTNPVYMYGNNEAGSLTDVSMAAGTFYEMPLDFLMPNGKYLFIERLSSAAVAQVEIFGYEEP